MHTWATLDHDDEVWYRHSGQAGARSSAALELRKLLSSPRLNALWERRFVALVEEHPGSAALAVRMMAPGEVRERLNRVCDGYGQGVRCADHALAQLYELRRIHELANSSAAARGAALILKVRPDVLLPELWRPKESIGRMEAALGLGATTPGPAAVLGHVGPWPGGWTDIAFATSRGTLDRLVAALPTLSARLWSAAPEPARGARGCAAACGEDACTGARAAWSAWRGGACCAVCRVLGHERGKNKLHAEQLWRELLLVLRVRTRGGWFLQLAKARPRLTRANGSAWLLGVERWHAYQRQVAIASLRAAPFSAKGAPPFALDPELLSLRGMS
jgi:hypothetical protein